MRPSPRIVVWDIETVMNVVAAFRLMNQEPLSHKHILQERYIVSAAWKVVGEPTVHAVSVLDDPDRFAKDVRDDGYVLTKLHEVLSGADILVAHNGDQYDIKFTETRLLMRGFPPLPPIPTIDTLKVAKGRFLFNSNRLDYLGRALGVGHKTPVDDDLWLRALHGDKAAIRQMVRYNKGDVVLLEKVFQKLQPYIPRFINRQLFTGESGLRCPYCGSTHIERRGYRFTATRRYPRFCCVDCRGWFKARQADPAVHPPVMTI